MKWPFVKREIIRTWPTDPDLIFPAMDEYERMEAYDRYMAGAEKLHGDAKKGVGEHGKNHT